MKIRFIPCERDGFPILEINGQQQCLKEYMEHCLGNQKITEVIQRDGTLYYIFVNGHELPLLCNCCGESLSCPDLPSEQKIMSGRTLKNMTWGTERLEDGRNVIDFQMEFFPKAGENMVLMVQTSVASAGKLIQGSQLLTPKDDYQALREFNLAYEGQTSPTEEMRLVYRDLLIAHPDLETKLANMPLRLFSGKENPSSGAKAVFFCYQIPGPDRNGEWSLETGTAQWFLYDANSQKIIEETDQINRVIKSEPETVRRCITSKETLVEARKEIEKFINKNYLRPRQAPIGQNAVLKAWMELN